MEVKSGKNFNFESGKNEERHTKIIMSKNVHKGRFRINKKLPDQKESK